MLSALCTRAAVQACDSLLALRGVRCASSSPSRKFDLEKNVFVAPGEQRVYAGRSCMDEMLSDVRKTSKRPLVVTDAGLMNAGVVDQVLEQMKRRHDFAPVLFGDSQPNPSHKDAVGIAQAFLQGDCDYVLGIGGGGPLDAAKGGMALVANQRVNHDFKLAEDGPGFVDNIRAFLAALGKNDAMRAQYAAAVPAMAAIPTTAGTGSEGGKSAVITNTSGVKVVFGNPVFLPSVVGLFPQVTVGLPPALTAATGVDAMFHCMEAYFVTKAAAYADGLTDEGMEECDQYALTGMYLVLKHLEPAFLDGTNLEARLHMLVAAFYGAKAFRKGDLGGVHATAHALGSLYHLHHGASIARMSVPVLEYNAPRVDQDTKIRFKMVHSLFPSGKNTLHESLHQFLRRFNIPVGLQQLERQPNDIETLAALASKDPCQTNPVPLKLEDYRSIFEAAAKL